MIPKAVEVIDWRWAWTSYMQAADSSYSVGEGSPILRMRVSCTSRAYESAHRIKWNNNIPETGRVSVYHISLSTGNNKLTEN